MSHDPRSVARAIALRPLRPGSDARPGRTPDDGLGALRSLIAPTPAEAARAALRAAVGLTIVAGAIVLGECLGGCATVAELAKPVTDWAAEPSLEVSAGVKIEDGEWTVTGGIDLGWIRAGVGGGCLLVPLEWCWKWPEVSP